MMTWVRRWKTTAKQLRRMQRAPAFDVLVRAYRRKQERIDRLEARVAELEGPDVATLGRVYSNTDAWLKVAGVADATTFERLLDGNLDVAVVLELEFERRFPREHELWWRRKEK